MGVASDSDESDDDEEPMSSDEGEGQRSISGHKPTLRLSGGFQWDVGVVSDTVGVAHDSSDSEMEVEEVRSVFSAVVTLFNSICCRTVGQQEFCSTKCQTHLEMFFLSYIKLTPTVYSNNSLF